MSGFVIVRIERAEDRSRHSSLVRPVATLAARATGQGEVGLLKAGRTLALRHGYDIAQGPPWGKYNAEWALHTITYRSPNREGKGRGSSSVWRRMARVRPEMRPRGLTQAMAHARQRIGGRDGSHTERALAMAIFRAEGERQIDGSWRHQCRCGSMAGRRYRGRIWCPACGVERLQIPSGGSRESCGCDLCWAIEAEVIRRNVQDVRISRPSKG